MGVLHEFTLQKSSPGISLVLYQAKKSNDPLMVPLSTYEVNPKDLLEISYLYIEGVHEGKIPFEFCSHFTLTHYFFFMFGS
jgi:hypothetical protein